MCDPTTIAIVAASTATGMSAYNMKRQRDFAEHATTRAKKMEKKAEAQLEAEAALRRPESRAEVALAEESPKETEGGAEFASIRERFTVNTGANV